MNILSSNLAIEMRGQGLSNEEVIQEILEYAEMLEMLTLASRVRAREIREMEIVSEEVKQW